MGCAVYLVQYYVCWKVTMATNNCANVHIVVHILQELFQ